MKPELSFFFAPDPQGVHSHRIAYREWSNASSARTTVCVHGLTRNSRDFDFLAPALNEDARVICPDMPGRGESQWLDDPHWYNYGVYYEDMMAMLQDLNIAICDWVGTSMGGIIGMMIASLHPERIRKLVLNDIGAYIPKAGLERIAQYVGRQMEFSSLQEGQDWLRAVCQPFGIKDERHWQHLFACSLRQEPGFVRLLYDPNIAESFRTERHDSPVLTEVDLWPLWEKITCPVLILRGQDSDILLHETATRMALGKPNVALIELPGIGHAPSLMEDDQIALVREWLND